MSRSRIGGNPRHRFHDCRVLRLGRQALLRQRPGDANQDRQRTGARRQLIARQGAARTLERLDYNADSHTACDSSAER